MILVDANLLIYAVNRDAHGHRVARKWLEKVLSESETVCFTWTVILAFLRITTRPGILAMPLEGDQAMAYVDEWLRQPVAVILTPGEGHWRILSNLLVDCGTLGNLTSDAQTVTSSRQNGQVVSIRQ